MTFALAVRRGYPIFEQIKPEARSWRIAGCGLSVLADLNSTKEFHNPAARRPLPAGLAEFRPITFILTRCLPNSTASL